MQNKTINTVFLGIIIILLAVGVWYSTKNKDNSQYPIVEEKNTVDQILDDTKSDKQVFKPAEVSSVVDANNQFAFELYSEINGEKGNIFVSPFSISSAVAMVYEGAKGKTADEIQSVFHFPKDSIIRQSAFQTLNDQMNNPNKDYKLGIANALWIQKDYKLLGGYVDTIKKYYGGNTTNLDFVKAPEASRKTINTWIENKTNDKIKDVIPQGFLNAYTRLVLTNAIYFKGQWVKQFDKKNTQDWDFAVNENKNVKVPMMSRSDEKSVFKYAEVDDFQVLEMLYEGKKLSMIVLLPKENDLSSVESSLSVDKIKKIKSSLKEQRVNIYIPKFKFDTKYFMADILQKMGMNTAFSGDADFSGIDGTSDLSISSIIHQAFVDVNEEGTEAAAATVVMMGVTSVGPSGPRIPVFKADHPFIFLIQDTQNGSILFVGRVEDPSKNN